ncbi:MAG: ribbon-helix-helix domain-containing protein [Thermoproteota archaeon]|jgi:metal-responsive CopG/Arc/MetJ family transcriptional regulator|nr:ribbon-helix-helix domain-containing protein [Nitrososphaerota archaeon]
MPKAAKRSKTLIYLTTELYARLDAYSKKAKITKSKIIRAALAEFLLKKKAIKASEASKFLIK